MRVGGQRHAPVALPPVKETPYQFYRRLGGPQGRSGRARKISPPPGFDPRTVQPVASRYTDYRGMHSHITVISVISQSYQSYHSHITVISPQQLIHHQHQQQPDKDTVIVRRINARDNKYITGNCLYKAAFPRLVHLTNIYHLWIIVTSLERCTCGHLSVSHPL